MNKSSKKATYAAAVAECAVCSALLIAAQVALGFVPGVEIVTPLLLCFACTLGVIKGVAVAVSFSLLRCFIWGFYPSVIILYLIYYPLFALIFALIGKIDKGNFINAKAWLFWTVNCLLSAICVLSGVAAGLGLIKISRLYKRTVTVLLWVICGICGGLLILFNVFFALTRSKKISGRCLEVFLYCTLACTLTACFTLLDDVITPLIIGMTPMTALAYFYASFSAMLPQVVCAAISVSLCYYPLTAAIKKGLGYNANTPTRPHLY